MSVLQDQIMAFVAQVGDKAAGKALGCAPSVIQRWKKGTHKPAIEHVERFMTMGQTAPAAPAVTVGALTPVKRQLPNMEPIDVDDAAPILPRMAAQPTRAVAVRVAQPTGLQAPAAGDVMIDEKISNKLPPNIAASNMSVNPFGGSEVPIVGPPSNRPSQPAQDIVENPNAVRPLNMPRGVISEEEYNKQMAASHQDPNAKMLAPQTPQMPAQSLNFSQPIPPFTEKPTLYIEPNYTLDQLQAMRDVLFNWKGRELAILMPIYKFVNPATNYVIAALIRDLGDKAHYFQDIGDAVIANSRNKLATRFLQTNTVWSLWIDDDMILPIGRAGWFKEICGLPASFPDKVAGEHVVTRLMSHRKTVVGATYFSRHAAGRPMSYEGQVEHAAHMAARNMSDGIRPATWVGTGCLLVHRQVYYDIQRTQPECAPSGGRTQWDYFRMPDTAGEDVGFCLRAAKAGHQVFTDTGLQCGHVGYNVWGAWNTNGGTVI